MGLPAPVTVDGRFTPAGFDLHFSGTTTLARLQAFNKSFGLLGVLSTRPPAVGATTVALRGAGTATLVLTCAANGYCRCQTPIIRSRPRRQRAAWSIRNAELTTSYLSQLLRIVSAQGILSPTQIAWTNASISYGKLETRERWSIRRCALAPLMCRALLADDCRTRPGRPAIQRCWAAAKVAHCCAKYWSVSTATQ